MSITQEIRDRLLAQLGPNHAAAYPRHLDEHYPHVFEKIVQLWGTPEAASFLTGLLVTERSGRRGFSPEAASDIMRLIDAYEQLGLAPPAQRRAGDVWDWISDASYFQRERGGGSY